MDVPEAFARRGASITLLCFAVAFALVSLLRMLPDSLSPWMAVPIVLGLLYGPWGALGSSVAVTLSLLLEGADPLVAAVCLPAVFMVSYVPYRAWYSTFTRVRPKTPGIGSSTSLGKLIFVLLIASVAYTAVGQAIHVAVWGSDGASLLDLSGFLLSLTWSAVLSLVTILLTGVFRISPWTPTAEIGRPRLVAPKGAVYDALFVIGTVVSLATVWAGDLAWAPALVGFALIACSCLKPMMTVRRWEAVGSDDGGQGLFTFRTQAGDRVIIMFSAFSILILVIVIAAFSTGILSNVPFIEDMAAGQDGMSGETAEELASTVSLSLYLFVVCLGQYVIVLVFLWYIERALINPIKTMSGAARDFIISDSAISADDVESRCSALSERTDEVGELSRSLIRLTRDMADYVQDIESLRRDKQAYRAELAIARQIQLGLIPKNFDSVEGTGVTIAGLMDTAKTVGGDLYDFMVLPSYRVAVFIGDVSGKGIPAALFMSRAKALMEDHTGRGDDPGTTFYEINNALSKENTQLLFVSSWHGVIDTRTGEMRFANAGHCPPLIWRADEGKASFVEMEPRPVLGVIPNSRYVTESLSMRVGDRLLLYTDGLTEANADYQGFYGSERLRDVFEDTCGLTPADQLKVIREDVKEFVGNAEQFDDMTMLLIRYDGRSTATGLRAPPGERSGIGTGAGRYPSSPIPPP